jgi:hypothetical protein
MRVRSSSMTRTIATIGLLALLVAAPAALAQDANETDEKPHVDCPPGETCSDKAAGGARPDDAAWVEDCPPDMMCAAGAEEYGSDGCIECTGGPVGETCMDGQQAGETCDPDVQYLGGPQQQAESADAKTVPALGALGLIAAFVAAVVIVSRRF